MNYGLFLDEYSAVLVLDKVQFVKCHAQVKDTLTIYYVSLD